MPITPIEMMQNLGQMDNVAKEASKLQGVAEKEQNQQAHLLEKTSRMVQEKLKNINGLNDAQRVHQKSEEENEQNKKNQDKYEKTAANNTNIKQPTTNTIVSKTAVYNYGEDPYKGKLIDIKE
jgi:hypothetical protein